VFEHAQAASRKKSETRLDFAARIWEEISCAHNYKTEKAAMGTEVEGVKVFLPAVTLKL